MIRPSSTLKDKYNLLSTPAKASHTQFWLCTVWLVPMAISMMNRETGVVNNHLVNVILLAIYLFGLPQNRTNKSIITKNNVAIPVLHYYYTDQTNVYSFTNIHAITFKL